jgi:hypothetical protein
LRRTGGTRATAPARARLPGKAGKPERVPARANKPISSAPFEHEVEKLAGQIAGDTEDQITIELARDAAEAELELARVGRLKVALTERLVAFGRFGVPKRFASAKDEGAWIMQNFLGATLWKGTPEVRRGGATRVPQFARAAALRSPRRHAQRPHRPLYRKHGKDGRWLSYCGAAQGIAGNMLRLQRQF